MVNQETVSDIIDKKELFNIEAEQAVLGTIIINNEYVNRVSEFLLAEHFYEPVNQIIYSQIIHVIDKVNVIANSITLKQFFDSNESIKAVGGSLYLSTLLSKATGIIDIHDYAKIIYDLALKRQLVIIGENIVNTAYKTDNQDNAEKQIEEAESQLFNLTSRGEINSDFKNISISLKETLENTLSAKQRDSDLSGVSTGFLDLDKILGGMQNSDLIILAARPSMGKTALAINIAINACENLNKNTNDKEKQAVGFFSLEMSSDQLSSRILSMKTSINSAKFRTGNLNDTEWQSLTKRSGEIAEMPFFIDDTPALSIASIRTRTRRLLRQHNLSLLIVDYLQLIRGSSRRSNDNRVQEISEITQGLKSIAKEFNIPIVALSQLSRAVEQREEKRPQLSDLRESGSIEQDADVVAFIYRESYYLERLRPNEDNEEKYNSWKTRMKELRNNQDGEKSEIIIAKQRNGPVGNINIYFDPEFTRFANFSDR